MGSLGMVESDNNLIPRGGQLAHLPLQQSSLRLEHLLLFPAFHIPQPLLTVGAEGPLRCDDGLAIEDGLTRAALLLLKVMAASSSSVQPTIRFRIAELMWDGMPEAGPRWEER